MTTGLKTLSKSDELGQIIHDKLKGTNIAHILILVNLNDDGTIKGISYHADGTKSSIVDILEFLTNYIKTKSNTIS